MTDPLPRLEPAQLSVEPGAEARSVITIRNLGTIVENFRLTLVDEGRDGGPANWHRIEPAEIPVYPQAEASAVLIFSPPPGRATPSGRYQFAISAASTVNESVSAAVEGELEVGGIVGIQAKLIPVTSSGRWGGRHTVQLSNWGNSAVRFRLVGSDPDQRLGFLIRPADVTLPLGATVTSRVKVRSSKPYLRGPVTRIPFQIVAEPESDGPGSAMPPLPADPRRPVLDGALNQKPIVSRLTATVAGLAVVAAVAALAVALRTPGKLPPAGTVGAPNPPTRLTAKAQPDSTIRLTWEPVSQVDSYILASLPASEERPDIPVKGDSRQFDTAVLSQGKTYCFTLKSKRAGLTSVASKRACATIAKATPSSSSTPPGSTSPGGPPPKRELTAAEYVALLRIIPDSTGLTAEIDAETEQEKFNLRSPGGARVLHSTKYKQFLIYDPEPRLVVVPSWIVYVRGSEPWGYKDAWDWCAKYDVQPQCKPARPGPIS
ncbi:MAG: hypothetical protein QOE53_870 [Pseudonocardiales bacterium]|jgi:hypothetical protein|nr:hypothetical protein [Pseudonocardiales bacterium]